LDIGEELASPAWLGEGESWGNKKQQQKEVKEKEVIWQ
jgi:hypothetical protein